jgi:hypothetical protein
MPPGRTDSRCPVNPPCPAAPAPAGRVTRGRPEVVDSRGRRSHPRVRPLPERSDAGCAKRGAPAVRADRRPLAGGVAVLAEPPFGRNPGGLRPQPLIGLAPRRPSTNQPGTLDLVPAAVARPRHLVAPARLVRPEPGRASPGHGPVSAGHRSLLAVGKWGVRCHPGADLSREISSKHLAKHRRLCSLGAHFLLVPKPCLGTRG